MFHCHLPNFFAVAVSSPPPKKTFFSYFGLFYKWRKHTCIICITDYKAMNEKRFYYLIFTSILVPSTVTVVQSDAGSWTDTERIAWTGSNRGICRIEKSAKFISSFVFFSVFFYVYFSFLFCTITVICLWAVMKKVFLNLSCPRFGKFEFAWFIF